MLLSAEPEDFVVEEIPAYAPLGEGDHTFVWVEKRLRTTDEAARWLSRAAGVRPRDVGHAGRKDKRAVTRQWFSVPGLDPQRARGLEAPGFRVLDAARHPHKLRTGQLRGNRFELVVRQLSPEQVTAAGERLAGLCERGMPNRYGPQRFGDGSGEAAARALLAGGPMPRDRRMARLHLSALQSRVFNDVLAARLADGAAGGAGIDTLQVGDVAYVHASGGSFVVEDLAAEAPRAAAFELSPTGPIFGTRLLEAQGAPGERERGVLSRHEIAEPGALRTPRGIRLRGARRPLRVRPGDAHCEPEGSHAVRLRFSLPSGSYATVLAAALFEPGDPPSQGPAPDDNATGGVVTCRSGGPP